MRLFTRIGLGLVALASLADATLAQSAYPSQPVRLVAPFGAGSQSDILARAFAEKLADRWKQQVIVENRPGLAGVATVAKAPADGSTLMIISNGHTIISALNKTLAFDPDKDFVAISKVASVPAILVAPEAGAKTLKEIIDAARASPGKLNYASAGLGSASSIGIELLKKTANVDLVHIPFKGLGDTHTATIRGDTQITMTFFSAAGDLIASGKLRALAVTSAKRLANLPNVPTAAEAGLPGYDYDPWFAIVAPLGTPKAIVDQVARDLAAVAEQPAIKDRFAKLGAIVETSSPAELDALMKKDGARFKALFAGAAK